MGHTHEWVKQESGVYKCLWCSRTMTRDDLYLWLTGQRSSLSQIWLDSPVREEFLNIRKAVQTRNHI
ncbi:MULTISPECIES: hypothetical protein [Dehalococcoides]|jgi:hypothetical protein|uniref:Uncharacterized protein n=1 Tax=Dehalococcoides mccartyi (strain VS) TaxID=311424 RepID=D2BIK4_DEHMV|nr:MULTISPECIES: hypothetical protein [Dehalococcoides]ACZ62154.1 hypothetical protein DhcVS_1037 [Dehalococcoides mccartyi VS]AHB13856.1 hypothetical protein GY50_1085 [Dehalococcoides mccartyi GY50]AII58212.1 hypothetical protein X792_05830 [Dehalococcoides mccartyi CG1]APH12790.1 hypothetical protein ASJ33_06305 [Dehalococcoides mccartyi]QYY57785.1 hypothetical protein CWV2_001042 [Dehalococcoides mccartyi]